MSDQFQRQAQQWQQQVARQSVDRARKWHQDMFNHQRDMHVIMAAKARSERNPADAVVGTSRRGGLVRAIFVVVLLGALAIGAFRLIRSGQLSAWLDLKDF
jgi:hypothetical protein